jgi:hypothetical protein
VNSSVIDSGVILRTDLLIALTYIIALQAMAVAGIVIATRGASAQHHHRKELFFLEQYSLSITNMINRL